MADKGTAPERVEAEVVEDRGLSVTFAPASIEANFAALDARVSRMIKGYEEARYDLTKTDDIKQAKRDRTYLNGIVKEIDERRKAVKREYMRPYDEFEAQANAITAKVKAASANIKAQLDEAEARRRSRAYDALRAHYEEVAELLAPVVPYERIHDDRWLNKTFGEVKAKAAIEERVARIARDWGALKEQRGSLPRYAEAERAFFETLDLGAAISAAREAQAADERIAEMRAAVEAPAAEPGAPEPPAPPSPAPAAAAPPAPEPIIVPDPGEGRKPWVVVIPAATRSDMLGLAKLLKMSDVTGEIRQGTLAQVWERSAYGR